jgi:hypothetical protein
VAKLVARLLAKGSNLAKSQKYKWATVTLAGPPPPKQKIFVGDCTELNYTPPTNLTQIMNDNEA